MPHSNEKPGFILTDIWQSFRALPSWVQIWVAVWLVPVNMISVVFIDQSMGIWIAVLANIAMILNLPIMLIERGFSKLMALPHIVPWTALIILIIFWRPQGSDSYETYLWVLLFTNIVSLIFDYIDAWEWWKGNRAVARPLQ